MPILLIFYALMSIFTFILFGIDKRKAQKNRFRIPEKTLIGFSLLGGGLGGWLGMRLFHHKTKHTSFRILVPLGAILWTLIVIAYYLWPVIDKMMKK